MPNQILIRVKNMEDQKIKTISFVTKMSKEEVKNKVIQLMKDQECDEVKLTNPTEDHSHKIAIHILEYNEKRNYNGSASTNLYHIKPSRAAKLIRSRFKPLVV